MDIAILLYETCEVEILHNVDEDMIDDAYDGDVESYLEAHGYNTNQIHYMCGDIITLTEK